MAPSLLMLVPSFLKFIFSEIQYIKMYLYGKKKISAVSQKEDVMIKKKKSSYLPRLLMVYFSKSQSGK